MLCRDLTVITDLSSAGAIQAAFDKYSRYLLAVHKRHQEADAKAKENRPTESSSAGMMSSYY